MCFCRHKALLARRLFVGRPCTGVSFLPDRGWEVVVHRLNTGLDIPQTPNPSAYTTPSNAPFHCSFLHTGRWGDNNSSLRNRSCSDYLLRRVDIGGWVVHRRCASSIPLSTARNVRHDAPVVRSGTDGKETHWLGNTLAEKTSPCERCRPNSPPMIRRKDTACREPEKAIGKGF